jgi:hypothetical protein
LGGLRLEVVGNLDFIPWTGFKKTRPRFGVFSELVKAEHVEVRNLTGGMNSRTDVPVVETSRRTRDCSSEAASTILVFSVPRNGSLRH